MKIHFLHLQDIILALGHHQALIAQLVEHPPCERSVYAKEIHFLFVNHRAEKINY